MYKIFSFRFLGCLASFLFFGQLTTAQVVATDSIPNPTLEKVDSLELGTEEMPDLAHIDSETGPKEWSFSATLNGDYRAGNLSRSLITLRTNIDYTNKKSIFGFYSTPSFSYGKTNDVLQEREIRIDLNPTLYYSTSNFYGLGFAVVETSQLRGFSSRIFAGLGLGIRVLGGIKKENSKFKITTTHAVLREKTDYFNATDIDVIRYSARIRINGQILDKKLSFFSTFFYQPALNKDNIRWNGIAGFNYKISRSVAFNISFDASYESLVIETRKKGDQHLMFGITFNPN